MSSFEAARSTDATHPEKFYHDRSIIFCILISVEEDLSIIIYLIVLYCI